MAFPPLGTTGQVFPKSKSRLVELSHESVTFELQVFGIFKSNQGECAVFSDYRDSEVTSILAKAGRPRILLVDDDVTFGKIMMKMASKLDLPLHYVSSVNDLSRISEPDFDVGIFDYDLGTITGVQLSDVVEKYVGKIPILLVSAYGNIESRKKWPASVRSFIPKSKGFYAILAEACRVFELGDGRDTESNSNALQNPPIH